MNEVDPGRASGTALQALGWILLGDTLEDSTWLKFSYVLSSSCLWRLEGTKQCPSAEIIIALPDSARPDGQGGHGKSLLWPTHLDACWLPTSSCSGVLPASGMRRNDFSLYQAITDQNATQHVHGEELLIHSTPC